MSETFLLQWNNVNPENKFLLKEFLIQLKQEGKSSSTMRTYESSIKLFLIYILEELDNVSILTLNRKAFRNYSLYLQDVKNVSTATHNHYISAIKSMLDRMEEDDDIDYNNNMARKIKNLKRDSVKEIYFLTDEQVYKLYNALLIKPRWYQLALFLSLAYDSTGRRAEIMQVTKQNFYIPNINNTNLIIKKGGKKEPLVYFQRTKDIAKIYLEYRGEDDNPSLWMDYHKGQHRKIHSPASWCETMSKLLSNIEGKDIWFTPHCIRHSAIENYTNGTHYMCPVQRVAYRIEDVQKLAGHSSSAMTQSYKKNVGLKSLENVFGIQIVD